MTEGQTKKSNESKRFENMSEIEWEGDNAREILFLFKCMPVR